MYRIAITELITVNEPTNNISSLLNHKHYLVTYDISLYEFMNNEHLLMMELIRESYEMYLEHSLYFDELLLEQFWNMKQYNLDIVEPYYLDTDEYVCIKKTFWLKLLQRKWKKIYHFRKQQIKRRKNPKSLLHREINGKWNNRCIKWM